MCMPFDYEIQSCADRLTSSRKVPLNIVQGLKDEIFSSRLIGRRQNREKVHRKIVRSAHHQARSILFL